MMLAPDFHCWLDYAPYGLDSARKYKVMLEAMRQLTQWHAQQCAKYQQVMKTLKVDPARLVQLEDELIYLFGFSRSSSC